MVFLTPVLKLFSHFQANERATEIEEEALAKVGMKNNTTFIHIKINFDNEKVMTQITCLYTVLGPMVRHYALNYGFHTFLNLLKNLLERHIGGFVCKDK